MNKSIRDQLQMQTKEWLIERLLELTTDDDTNSDRIALYLSVEKNDDLEVIREFKSLLDKAIEQIKDHGGATWRNPLSLTTLNNICDTLAKVSINYKHKVVLEVAEYALLAIDSISELQEECELDYLVDAFRELHLTACYKLKPEPESFGIHLAELSKKI